MITVNTKPLLTALNLAVVNSNVSKYYKKSCLAQITISPTAIKFNFEAANVVSEISLKGASTSPDTQVVMVDNMVFKQLISTLSSSMVSLDILPDSLVITSGKSRFTLPRIDSDGLELKVPSEVNTGRRIDLDRAAWKFIKENQMYAVAMSFIHPVYTRVWVSETGDVLAGDFDKSIFTYSHKSDLQKTCLLSDTIVNLITALPEGAVLYDIGDRYQAQVVADSFTYLAEFVPELESVVGSYNSDIIMSTMNHPDNCFAVAASQLNQILGQALLLSTDSEASIKFTVQNNELILQDRNIKSSIEIQFDGEFQIECMTDSLKSVIASYGDTDIRIAPSVLDDEVVGIVVWGDELTTVFAGVDDGVS